MVDSHQQDLNNKYKRIFILANSKAIGNSYEREISKKLSLWLTYNNSDDVVWRDLSSGARATTRKKQNKQTNIKGDIVAVDLNYKWFTDLFFIDSKCYKSFNPFFIDPKNKKSNDILNQWLKVSSDCPTNMIPFMICKIRDRKTSEFIMFNLPKESDIHEKSFLVYGYVCHILESKAMMTWKEKDNMAIIVTLEDFFKYIDPNKIKSFLET